MGRCDHRVLRRRLRPEAAAFRALVLLLALLAAAYVLPVLLFRALTAYPRLHSQSAAEGSDGMRDQLVGKILAVVERVGVTDTAAEIVIDLVLAWSAEETREYERVKKRRQRVPGRPGTREVSRDVPDSPGTGVVSGSGSDLDLSFRIPDPSKPIREDHGLMSRNPFGRALAQFCGVWQGRYGVPYEPTPADRNQLGRLVRTLAGERLHELPIAFEAYLADLSPFVAQEMRHSLCHFCAAGGFNKYRAVAPILSRKEAATVASAEQWIAMQERTNGTK
jgi:hypothetical protein